MCTYQPSPPLGLLSKKSHNKKFDSMTDPNFLLQVIMKFSAKVIQRWTTICPPCGGQIVVHLCMIFALNFIIICRSKFGSVMESDFLLCVSFKSRPRGGEGW